MNNLRKVLTNLTNHQAWFILAVYILFMIISAVFLQRYIDREWLRSIVDKTGSLGILIFLLIEYLYVIFVPIYNTAIHIAAGYIFGGTVGWFLNFLATSAGLFTIIILIKKYGRLILAKAVSPKILKLYDSIIDHVGPITLFVIYALPLFPDDEITYIIAAGGKVGFSRFIAPVLLGNIAKTSVSYIGDTGTQGISMAIDIRLAALIVGIVIIGVQEFYIQKSLKFRNLRS